MCVKAEKSVKRAHQKEAKEAQNIKKKLFKSPQRTSTKQYACLSQRPSVRNVWVALQVVLKVVLSLHHLLRPLHPR
jgi:hypothetical protein